MYDEQGHLTTGPSLPPTHSDLMQACVLLLSCPQALQHILLGRKVQRSTPSRVPHRHVSASFQDFLDLFSQGTGGVGEGVGACVFM